MRWIARSCSARVSNSALAVIGYQRAVDVVAQRLGLRGHQVPANPFPDRFERHAREPADPLVVGPIVK
jgi:hypothetical protein